jgi:hypothetical protein
LNFDQKQGTRWYRVDGWHRVDIPCAHWRAIQWISTKFAQPSPLSHSSATSGKGGIHNSGHISASSVFDLKSDRQLTVVLNQIQLYTKVNRWVCIYRMKIDAPISCRSLARSTASRIFQTVWNDPAGTVIHLYAQSPSVLHALNRTYA